MKLKPTNHLVVCINAIYRSILWSLNEGDSTLVVYFYIEWLEKADRVKLDKVFDSYSLSFIIIQNGFLCFSSFIKIKRYQKFLIKCFALICSQIICVILHIISSLSLIEVFFVYLQCRLCVLAVVCVVPF